MVYFLVGYMASGKTTMAKKLSEKFNIEYIDIDEMIETSEDLSISDIFELKGESYFRDKESLVLKELVNDHKDCIISCGGGLPLFNNNMEFMNKNGITIYIKCSPETIMSRLSNEEINKRPILKNRQNENILEIIKKDIKKREKFYKKAAIVINYENLNIEWP